MSEQEKALILAEDKTTYGSYRTMLLSRPTADYQGGLDGCYRLLTAVMGGKRVVLYEAISGDHRYPPGRNMHVELSFAEMDNLLEAYAKIKAETEEREAAYQASAKSGDDFDPFLDSDELP